MLTSLVNDFTTRYFEQFKDVMFKYLPAELQKSQCGIWESGGEYNLLENLGLSLGWHGASLPILWEPSWAGAAGPYPPTSAKTTHSTCWVKSGRCPGTPPWGGTEGIEPARWQDGWTGLGTARELGRRPTTAAPTSAWWRGHLVAEGHC